MVTVEIWSDVMCPFCYIGKRRFEEALTRFDGEVDVVWRSFQLDPTITRAGTVGEYLMMRKGWAAEQAEQAHAHVIALAKDSGLDINPGDAVLANTFDAHRLIHLASEHGLAGVAEERLFKAHFVDGLDVGDQSVLAGLAEEIGLDRKDAQEVLSTDRYADAVRADIARARSLGVNGVPFFVFDNKLAVSGAQGVDVFLSALKQAFEIPE